MKTVGARCIASSMTGVKLLFVRADELPNRSIDIRDTVGVIDEASKWTGEDGVAVNFDKTTGQRRYARVNAQLTFPLTARSAISPGVRSRRNGPGRPSAA
jgi:hypothetical protein